MSNQLVTGGGGSGVSAATLATIITKYTQTGINLKSGTAQLIYTTENNGKLFFLQALRLVVTTVDTINTYPTFTLGTNNPTYDDLISSVEIAHVDSVGQFSWHATQPSVPTSVDPNTGIYLLCGTPADATTLTVRAEILGDYEA